MTNVIDMLDDPRGSFGPTKGYGVYAGAESSWSLRRIQNPVRFSLRAFFLAFVVAFGILTLVKVF